MHVSDLRRIMKQELVEFFMLEDGYEKICNIKKALDAKAKIKVSDIGSQLASRSSLNCFRPKV